MSAPGAPAPGASLKQWTLGALLGRGAFGGVYEAVGAGEPAGSGPFAVKVVPLEPQSAASRLGKGMKQSREAALLYKEYNLYSGEERERDRGAGAGWDGVLGVCVWAHACRARSRARIERVFSPDALISHPPPPLLPPQCTSACLSAATCRACPAARTARTACIGGWPCSGWARRWPSASPAQAQAACRGPPSPTLACSWCVRGGCLLRGSCGVGREGRERIRGASRLPPPATPPLPTHPHPHTPPRRSPRWSTSTARGSCTWTSTRTT